MEIRIEKATIFVGSDGALHGSFEEALTAERRNALYKVVSKHPTFVDWYSENYDGVIEFLLENDKEIASILSFVPIVTNHPNANVFARVPTRTGDDIDELDLV